MKVHLTGIGGIGMSALARFYLQRGFKVSGSDFSETDLVRELIKEGVEIISEQAEFAIKTDLFVYTEAIPKSHPQFLLAKKRGLKMLSYFQALGEVSKNYKTIAVCGTHGKSTVTSMAGIAMKNLNLDPLVIVGTKVREFAGKNINFSQKEDYFLVEACEYRENFLPLYPSAVVFLNCEYDHHDYYPSFAAYKEAYLKLLKKLPASGFVVANFDDPSVKEIVLKSGASYIPVYFSKIKNPISPKVKGAHNRMNAEMVLALIKGLEPNFAEEKIRAEIAKFAGTWRRFEFLGKKGNVDFIDDYAHHPTEITATLSALNEYAPAKKKYVLFQAHQYSRTRQLFDEFIEAFAAFKNEDLEILLTEIYEARDSAEDKASVSGEKLTASLKAAGMNAKFLGTYEHAEKYLTEKLQEEAVFLSMGAGPVNLVLENLLKK